MDHGEKHHVYIICMIRFTVIVVSFLAGCSIFTTKEETPPI